MVQALAPVRGLDRLRRVLNLPANHTIDPLLCVENSRGMRIIQTRVHRKFRRAMPALPADTSVLPHFRAHTFEYPEKEYVTVLERGSAWGYVHGAVFTSEGEFVPTFARDPWGPRLHQVWTRARLPQPKRINGRALYLVTPEAADNYHHWMIDLLPRIGMVTRAGFPIEAFDHIILNQANRAYQWETLTRLGVKKEQMIQVSPSVRLQPDELVVPSLKGTNEQMPAEHVRFLRDTFLGTRGGRRGEGRRKLFLSRKDAPSRKLANEDEVFALLQPMGFESVSLTGRSVCEQARLFSEAEIIVGPSGAAFANLVFASPGTRVVEFASPTWLTVYHWMISARRGLPHTIILGPGGPPPRELNITGRAGDLVADISKLKRVLETLVVDRSSPSTTKSSRSIETGYTSSGRAEVLGSKACASL
ncbi:MAG TPA: glycosyltransferase family 61 protein [Opitutaceae bacterium]|nr:glycosyltransferase family 61 protein [Opitutaceae bacterium]